MTPVRIIFCTIDNKNTAQDLARKLVQNRLAACVNIIENMVSIYKWKDEIEEDVEVLMVIKTRKDRLQELIAYVSQFHPYDVPEILSCSVDQGNASYLDWVVAETK